MHNRTKHVLIVIAIFIAEILVATKFSSIRFVRGYLSDFLVVILLYHLVKIFHDLSNAKLASLVFIFSCGVEISQYFHLADVLGFRRGGLISILMGNSFSWMDILMYLLGCMTAYSADTWLISRSNPRQV